MRSLKIKILSLSLSLLISFVVKGQNNEPEKKTPDLTFSVKKLSDGGFEIKSRLSLFENRVDFPISGAIIDYQIGSDSIIKIDGNFTDKNGYATAFIKPGIKLPRDKEGVITASATFPGNDLYETASTEIVFTETRIDITCEMVDTIKTVFVKAFKINTDGTESPLAGESVTVSVQRMLSRLPIGDVSLDDSGNGSVEFPNNLPGDSLGNIHAVAFIADHDIYGNVENSAVAQWGIPKQKLLVTHRALWTQIAPMWMIVSLTILLTGVWAHYIYVAFQLYIIRLKGKKTVVE